MKVGIFIFIIPQNARHRSLAGDIGEALFGFRGFEEPGRIELENFALYEELDERADRREFAANGACFKQRGVFGLLRCENGKIAPKDFEIVMGAGEDEPLGFQDAIEINQVAFVSFDGFRAGLTFVLEIFEEGAEPAGKIGVEVHALKKCITRTLVCAELLLAARKFRDHFFYVRFLRFGNFDVAAGMGLF